MIQLRRIVPLFLIAAGLFALMMPACDKLVTEVNEYTIAGNPTAEFALDTDTSHCLDSGGICQGDSGCAPLIVRFLDLSNGPRDQWIWDFGDGVVDTVDSLDTAGINPIHVYREAGTYAVRLTILDHSVDEEPGADTEVKRRFIIVGTTVDSFSAEPTDACRGTEIAFSPHGYGGVKRFDWKFGDGTSVSSQGDTTHVYDSAGVYSCTLNVIGADSSCGDMTIAYDSLITIEDCPIARVAADTTEGCLPLTVILTDSSDYGVSGRDSVNWFLGDSAITNKPTDTIVFDSQGLYVVSMTAFSAGGTSTDTLDDTIRVWGDQGLDFLVNGGHTTVGGCHHDQWLYYVEFEAVLPANVDTQTYDKIVWFFGDGTQSNPDDSMPVKVLHPYSNPGDYTVSLYSYSKCGGGFPQIIDYPNIICIRRPFDTTQSVYKIEPDADPATPGVQGDTSVLFTLTDSTVGENLAWAWDFGDDSPTAFGQFVQHQYSDTGTFVVRLTIDNCCLTKVWTDTMYIDTTATQSAFRRYPDTEAKR